MAGTDYVCTRCGARIEPHTKFLCIYKTSNGFVIQVWCHHYMPPLGFSLIFGGGSCFHAWLEEWEQTLQVCDHSNKN